MLSADRQRQQQQQQRRRFWVPILLYHRIVPVLPARDPYQNCVTTAVFENQLRWLARRDYRSVPLADLEPCFAAPTGAAAARHLPRRPVVITFDDGYRDNYLHAWPLLQRYGFTATIFLVTDVIGGDNRFDAAEDCGRAAMLSASEIREMHRHGIQFGSHTGSHPQTLVGLPDEELESELTRSREAIERLLDAAPRGFSYPHSKQDSRVEQAVERAGYTLACGGVGTRFSPFSLHRIEPHSRQGIATEVLLKQRRLKWLLKNWKNRPAWEGEPA